MNTTKWSTKTRNSHRLADAANDQLGELKSPGPINKSLLVALALMLAGVASAANVPAGLTGFWRFQSETNKLKATLGADLTTSDPGNSTWFLGPWTVIEPGYSDGGVVQERKYDYLTVNPSFTANGGGNYVNEYTIAIDYVQTSEPTNWNSLFQTALSGTGNDGDLWTDGAGHIGNGDAGYSTLTYDASIWHRIVWSVDNGSSFRVYVDGVLFLDGAAQAVDERFSLFPDKFHLFADNNGEDQWGLVGTVATWNRALTTEEVAGMGGWTNGAVTPTPLIFCDTTTNAAPIIASVSPANGETNVAPRFAYQAIVVDSSTATADKSSIQLLLDGIPATPIVTSALGVITIKFSAGGLLRGGSTHKYTLSFNTTGVVSSITKEATFTVQHYTSYEWRFTQGDLSTALGNGTMSYFSDPAGTTFGTTDGSTVPHIAGNPAKYMHVPDFTLDDDGYHLIFAESGPNVGTNAYINRYTLLFDILIPNLTAQHAPDYIVPFFNTGPYNDSDADFYLRESGQIGIGGGGYSNPGVITANVWNRIAFVADLEANTLTYYVNGTSVKSRAADSLGGRWSLYSSQDVGPFPSAPANMLLFNEGDTGAVYTHDLFVSSVAFTDRVLGAAEVAALGWPNAHGILVRNFAPPPALTIQTAGGGAAVSWPTSYVGYALEQTDTVSNPLWKPVPGITNNAVTLTPSGFTRFFRLVQ